MSAARPQAAGRRAASSAAAGTVTVMDLEPAGPATDPTDPPGPEDLDGLTAAVARLEGEADALDARLDAAARPGASGAPTA